jgi:hypothetical protein
MNANFNRYDIEAAMLSFQLWQVAGSSHMETDGIIRGGAAPLRRSSITARRTPHACAILRQRLFSPLSVRVLVLTPSESKKPPE